MREVNRVASAILAMVLIIAGALVVVQTVSALIDRPWPIERSWYDRLATTPWSDRAVLVTALIVGAIGLLALVAQFLPRRQRYLPADANGSLWWVSRRSLERRAAHAAQFRGGAQHTKVSIQGDARRWRVRLRGDAPPHRRDGVVQAVRQELVNAGAPSLEFSLALRQPKRVA